MLFGKSRVCSRSTDAISIHFVPFFLLDVHKRKRVSSGFAHADFNFSVHHRADEIVYYITNTSHSLMPSAYCHLNPVVIQM